MSNHAAPANPIRPHRSFSAPTPHAARHRPPTHGHSRPLLASARAIAARSACAALLSATPLASGQGYGYGPGMMGGYGWGGGWGFGMLGMLLWWVLIILGIVLLAKWIFSGSAGRSERASPARALDILNERYARGEIDKKEFDEKKRDLGA